MTTLLEKAFPEAAKPPASEQELLASRLLAELVTEYHFDRTPKCSSSKLYGLAQQALVEYRSGETEEVAPEPINC